MAAMERLRLDMFAPRLALRVALQYSVEVQLNNMITFLQDMVRWAFEGRDDGRFLYVYGPCVGVSRTANITANSTALHPPRFPPALSEEDVLADGWQHVCAATLAPGEGCVLFLEVVNGDGLPVENNTDTARLHVRLFGDSIIAANVTRVRGDLYRAEVERVDPGAYVVDVLMGEWMHAASGSPGRIYEVAYRSAKPLCVRAVGDGCEGEGTDEADESAVAEQDEGRALEKEESGEETNQTAGHRAAAEVGALPF